MSDEFTKAELEELFEPPKNTDRKIVNEISHAAGPIDRVIEPFGLDEKDPNFEQRPPVVNHNPKRNSVKVLTILKPRRIMPSTIKRKDDKMATKNKTQTNYMQTGSVALLAAGAILGLADLLGGGLKACFVAALLVACLFVMAVDYRK